MDPGNKFKCFPPDLAKKNQWDARQNTDMLVVRACKVSFPKTRPLKSNKAVGFFSLVVTFFLTPLKSPAEPFGDKRGCSVCDPRLRICPVVI